MEFLEPVNQLILDNGEYIASVMAVFVRVSVLAFFLPGIGETQIPVRARLIAAFVITWMIVPPVLARYEVDTTSAATITAAFFAEAFSGFILGFAFRVMIWVLQIAGTIIAQAMSLSQLLGSTSEEPNTTISSILILAGTALAVSMDLHIEAIRVLIQSYDTFALGQFADTDTAAYWSLRRCAEAFSFALALSLPFVILNFIYNVMLGAISRAMPQLMVAFVGIPAITGAGLLLFFLCATTILTVWAGGFSSVLDDIIAMGR